MSDVRIWCHGTAVAVPDGTFERHGEPRTLIRFAGPVLPEWTAALAARGITVEFWAPPFGACVSLPAGMRSEQLAEFPFVAGAIAYRQEHCARPLTPPSEQLRVASGMPIALVDIVCFGRERRPAVEDQLRALGIPILGSSSSKIRVQYGGDLDVLRDLQGVKIADYARAPVLLGMAAAAPPSSTQVIAGLPPDLDGRGEIVAVADTGLDVGADGAALHHDFRGRIDLIASWPTNPSWTGFITAATDDDAADRNSGHGTHVAGLAVGDGAMSGGAHRGAAPGARLVFQALEQFCDVVAAFRSQLRSGYYLSGRPLDLRELFGQARGRGARIHINSWGDPAQGAYTDDCFETDLFLHEYPDAVILFAAGNDGADRDGDGRIESGSLYAPAAAKNAIAIGATEGPANTGLRRTWADFDPRAVRFRNPLDRAGAISGHADRIACFSSAGPSADGRTKPDLCAPGTNLAAPRSQACPARGWGLADPLPHYMYDGGTSAATAVAGGWTALVRQAWREANGGDAPSGAALKALLILGARPVGGRGEFERALAREGGHGAIDVVRSLPSPRITLFEERDGLATGDERRFFVDVPAAAVLRAVLCWYDAPGERLINDLDLDLLRPDGTAAARPPDRINPLEILEERGLEMGRYALRVKAFNVPAAPQLFALAVSITTDGAIINP